MSSQFLKGLMKAPKFGLNPAVAESEWTEAGGGAVFYVSTGFLPAWLLHPFLALDRRLESSRLRRFSAHYMAVFRKSPAPAEMLQQLSAEPVIAKLMTRHEPQAAAVCPVQLCLS